MKKLSAVFLLCILSCAEAQEVTLSDGFEYFRNFGTVHSIARPNGKILVHGDVFRVVEANNLIVGLRIEGKPRKPIPEGFRDQPYGYFIYDKSKNKLKMGLSLVELKNQIREYKIDYEKLNSLFK